jgi:hypothetical protein
MNKKRADLNYTGADVLFCGVTPGGQAQLLDKTQPLDCIRSFMRVYLVLPDR